ncbi:hypothetical protein PanWU01x14_119400 [Parasponia andersonii]|uniref:Transmembrane protein n=1 Tax=Parasponia andersonii TaxID=3476 RepID=A0A2P5CVD2_PARAD|nr:hypothetical protein PanWU01x14_119400 [Parasponia andersonii]
MAMTRLDHLVLILRQRRQTQKRGRTIDLKSRALFWLRMKIGFRSRRPRWVLAPRILHHRSRRRRRRQRRHRSPSEPSVPRSASVKQRNHPFELVYGQICYFLTIMIMTVMGN